jgi:ketosteroid isomerase-like protein
MTPISSAAHVTAVLRLLQAFNRNDIDACEQLFDPEAEWHCAVTYKGRGEVRSMLESYSERFTQPQVRPDDFKAAGAHVLMIVCFYEGDSTAQPREQRQSWIVELSEAGLVRRLLAYPSPAEASRAFEALAAAAALNVHA